MADKKLKKCPVGIPLLTSTLRMGLMHSLQPNYLASYSEKGKTTVAKMYLCLLRNDKVGINSDSEKRTVCDWKIAA